MAGSSAVLSIGTDNELAQLGITIVTVTLTGDDATGAVPDLTFDADTLEALKGKWLYKVDISYGGTTMDAAWDLTIKNVQGIDVLGDGGVGLDGTAGAAGLVPLVGSTPKNQVCTDAWTIAEANNGTASGVAVLQMFFLDKPQF